MWELPNKMRVCDSNPTNDNTTAAEPVSWIAWASGLARRSSMLAGLQWHKECVDCNGEPNGSAFVDDCGECVGGSTGKVSSTTTAVTDQIHFGRLWKLRWRCHGLNAV